jgi:hypothetical protein
MEIEYYLLVNVSITRPKKRYIEVKSFLEIYIGKAKDRVLVVLLSDRIEMLPE